MQISLNLYMDTFSHALWGKGLFGYRKYRFLAIFFGAFPDVRPAVCLALFPARIVNKQPARLCLVGRRAVKGDALDKAVNDIANESINQPRLRVNRIAEGKYTFGEDMVKPLLMRITAQASGYFVCACVCVRGFPPPSSFSPFSLIISRFCTWPLLHSCRALWCVSVVAGSPCVSICKRISQPTPR